MQAAYRQDTKQMMTTSPANRERDDMSVTNTRLDPLEGTSVEPPVCPVITNVDL